jgi:aspartyl protease family protein
MLPMLGPQIPPTLIAVIALLLAGSARLGRDIILDTINPVANAAVTGTDPTQMAKNTALPLGTATIVKSAHHIQRGTDGLFYVNVLINDRPIRFLIDTGASVVVLTAADARQAGIKVHETSFNRSVDTVGGAAPMAWATLDKVNLAGHEVRGLKAAVVRNGLGVSLLGQNMLAKLDSITLTADRVSLR